MNNLKSEYLTALSFGKGWVRLSVIDECKTQRVLM
jgi:hypothetical protein